MTDDHAANFARRAPRADPRIHASAFEADLVLRAVRVLLSVRREPSLVSAPTQLGGGDAFFVQALDAPGVHELVAVLRTIRPLRIPLADMNHLHARQPSQFAERLPLDRLSERRHTC